MTGPERWDDLSRLLQALGREAHLAARITEERRARGWSQERLARELVRVGCRMPQSAISKIENPAAPGRRAITVDEAMAFSRVFDMPLGALLLPREAVYEATLTKDVADGPGRRKQFEEAAEAYVEFVSKLAIHTGVAAKDPERWDQFFARELSEAREVVAATNEEGKPDAEARVAFLEDIIERRRRVE
jgi:transcriptional regulator with XRE-family HTH domain